MSLVFEFALSSNHKTIPIGTGASRCDFQVGQVPTYYLPLSTFFRIIQLWIGGKKPMHIICTTTYILFKSRYLSKDLLEFLEYRRFNQLLLHPSTTSISSSSSEQFLSTPEMKSMLTSLTYLMDCVSIPKDLPLHLKLHRTIFEGYDDIPDDVSNASSGGVSIGDLNARITSKNRIKPKQEPASPPPPQQHRRRCSTPPGCQP